MKKQFLTLFFALLLCTFGASAQDWIGDVLKYDNSGFSATQSYEEDNGYGAGSAQRALDGNTGGLLAGWDNNKLRDNEGNQATSNPLDLGANWWMVDFGEIIPIDAMKIYFEGAYGTSFQIEFFTEKPADGTTPATVFEEITNTTTAFDVNFDKTYNARYVRLNFTGATNVGWGLKFYEVEFFAEKEGFTSAVLTGDASVLYEGMTQALKIKFVGDDKELTLPSYTVDRITDEAGAETDGITYNAETGMFTANTAGTYIVYVTRNEFTLPVTVKVKAIPDCLLSNEGLFPTIVEFNPASGLRNDGTTLFDHGATNTISGWADNALTPVEGGQVELAEPATITIDMGRPCTVEILKIGHSDSWPTLFDVEFFAKDPNTGAQPIASKTGITNNAAAVQDIYFGEGVENARYLRLTFHKVRTTAWGLAFREICVLGSEVVLKVKSVKLSPDFTGYVGMDAPATLVVEYTNGLVTEGVTGFTVNAATLPEGLSFNAETGVFTATAAGDYTVEVSLPDGDDTYYPVTVSFKDLKPCVTMAEGLLKTNVTISPQPKNNTTGEIVATQGNPENLFDENEDNQFGWPDNTLGTTNNKRNLATLTIDLRRTCSIQGVKINHSGAYAKLFDLEFYDNNPSSANATLVYSQKDIENNSAGNQVIMFPEEFDAQYVRMRIHGVANITWGMKLREFCVYGEAEPVDMTNVVLRNSTLKYAIENDGTDYVVVSGSLYNKATNRKYFDLNPAEIHWVDAEGNNLDEELAQWFDYNANNGRLRTKVIDGAKLDNGVYYYTISYQDESVEEPFVSEPIRLEVATADWSNDFNIARRYTSIKVNNTATNGLGLGNPFAAAYHNSKTTGATNQSISGLIDGDWMAWNITPEEMREGAALYLDFGASVTVDESAVHFTPNATDDDNEENAWYMSMSRYKIYGGNIPAGTRSLRAAHIEGDPLEDAGTAVNGELIDELVGDNWVLLTETVDFNDNVYGVPDRHVWTPGDYRFLKFEFKDERYEGLGASISEITVTGPDFLNEDGTPNVDKYGDFRTLHVTAPTFNLSNAADRTQSNDWVVTSTRVNEAQPLRLSYQALNILGEPIALADDEEIRLDMQIVKVMKEGMTDENGNSYEGQTFEITPELKANGEQVYCSYFDISWPCYSFKWPADLINSEGLATVNARIVKKGGDLEDGSEDVRLTSKPFDVYIVSTRGNVNRFTYAYDNAEQYSENWNDKDAPDYKKGDRDIEFIGTAPENAADGDYYSWYVIGYYGPGNTMGQTYKYDKDEVLEKPYELVLDYRGTDAQGKTEGLNTWASTVDLIGLRFEGAFARDYDVYLLTGEIQSDGTLTVNTDAEGNEDWQLTDVWTNVQNFGIGQYETQYIFPKSETDGTPIEEADKGRYQPWENVVAVKFVFKKLGTPYGLKILESAVYGTLNRSIIDTEIEQLVYTDPEEVNLAHRTSDVDQEAGLYYSFNLRLSSQSLGGDYQSEVYTPEEVEEIKEQLKEVDHYTIRVSKRKVRGAHIDEGSDDNNDKVVDGEQEDGSIIESGVQWGRSKFVADNLPAVLAMVKGATSKERDDFQPVEVRAVNSNGTSHDEGKYDPTDNILLEFDVPAYGLEETADEEGNVTYTPVDYFTDIIIKDVEPTYYYRIAGVDVYKNETEILSTINFTESKRTRLLAPYVKYDLSRSSFGFFPEKNQYGNEVNTDPETGEMDFVNTDSWSTNEQHHHLGSTETTDNGGFRTVYTHANRVSLEGYFDQLMLTQPTLDNWDIYYQVEFDIDVERGVTADDVDDNDDVEGIDKESLSNDYKFDGYFRNSLKKGLNNNPLYAPLTYLPLPITYTSVANGEDEDMPQSVKDIMINSIDDKAVYTVRTHNRVTYIHPEHGNLTMARSMEDFVDTLDMTNLTSKIEAINAARNEANDIMLQRNGHYSTDLNAFYSLAIDRQANSDVFRYIGFHATNERHESLVGDEITGAEAYGKPVGTAEYAGGLAEYGEENTNFGKLAAEQGLMAINLQNVVNEADFDEEHPVPTIYNVLTAEYPIVLGYYSKETVEDEDGNTTETTTFHSHPAVYVNGMRWEGHKEVVEGPQPIDEFDENGEEPAETQSRRRIKADSPADIDADHSEVHQYQTLSTATIVPLDITTEDVPVITGLANVAAADANLRVWPVPADDVLNLEAGCDLGNIEFFNVSGALVKVHEADGDKATVNVSTLAPGMYVVRAAGTSTRILKR